MEKKRRMSNDKFIEMTPHMLAGLYQYPKNVNYKVSYNSKRVIIDDFVNSLHEMQLEYIDEAVEKSDLKQANDVIKQIMEKK